MNFTCLDLKKDKKRVYEIGIFTSFNEKYLVSLFAKIFFKSYKYD